jgi:hypothetical protein
MSCHRRRNFIVFAMAETAVWREPLEQMLRPTRLHEASVNLRSNDQIRA